MSSNRIVTCLAALAGAAGFAAAEPSLFLPQMSLRSLDAQYNDLDALETHMGDWMEPGTTSVMHALDPAYGGAVEVSFEVETVGLQRRVLITYRSLGESFVTPEAIGFLETIPGGSFDLRFGVSFTDDEWDGQAPLRSMALFGDGAVISNPPPLAFPAPLSPSSHGFADAANPGEPGFFGAFAAPDMFMYEVTYTIVPAPAGALALGGAGLAVLRRRR